MPVDMTDVLNRVEELTRKIGELRNAVLGWDPEEKPDVGSLWSYAKANGITKDKWIELASGINCEKSTKEFTFEEFENLADAIKKEISR